MEALKAELAVTKEAAFNEHAAAKDENSKEHVALSAEPVWSGWPGGGVGIGLAVAAGVILFAVQAEKMSVQERQTVQAWQAEKSSVQEPHMYNL